MQLLNKCPICGGKLYEDNLYQYSRIYEIGKSGKTLSKYKKGGDCPMECAQLYCENKDFITDFEFNVEIPDEFDGRIIRENGKYYIDTEKHGWWDY